MANCWFSKLRLTGENTRGWLMSTHCGWPISTHWGWPWPISTHWGWLVSAYWWPPRPANENSSNENYSIEFINCHSSNSAHWTKGNWEEWRAQCTATLRELNTQYRAITANELLGIAANAQQQNQHANPCCPMNWRSLLSRQNGVPSMWWMRLGHQAARCNQG